MEYARPLGRFPRLTKHSVVAIKAEERVFFAIDER